jgi:predicted RNA-binding Zn ribbon-like protein
MASAATWDWLGGPLAVDFANTVRREGARYRELFETGEDVSAWAGHQRGRVPRVSAAQAERRLHEVRVVRDDVFEVLAATVAGTPFSPHAVRRLNDRVCEQPLIVQLLERPGRWRVLPRSGADAVDELLVRVTHAAIELAGPARRVDLAFCDAPTCGQFFVRHRPNQHWCGPACGSRARVARHAGYGVEPYAPLVGGQDG